MARHETRPDSPVEVTEEHRDPCQSWRGTLSFWPQMQMRTSALEPTAVESWGGGGPSLFAWRLGLPKAPRGSP